MEDTNMNSVRNVGVVGAGAISGIYLKNMINKFSNINPVSISSAHLKSAEEKANEFGLAACTLDEMLSRDDIDIIVNLTPVSEHYGIVKKALLSGKNVYTEKTIAATVEQARELCTLANDRGIYLGSAPDTFLGSSWQGARRILDNGKIGDVNSFSISINRCNDFLTGIFPFLRLPGAGALRDYEVYYITALVSLLGPVSRVCAFVRTPYPERLNNIPGTKNYAQTIQTPNESIVTAVVELESGVTGTIHHNQESCKPDRADFAIYGREGILLLGNPNYFGRTAKILRNPETIIRGVEQEPSVEILEPANEFSENSRGLGVAEMATAIETGRQNRASKELALHVLDVLESIELSGKTGRMIDITSSCERPAPFYGLEYEMNK